MKELIGDAMSELPDIQNIPALPEVPIAYMQPAEFDGITEPAAVESPADDTLSDALRRIKETEEALEAFGNTLDEDTLDAATARVEGLPDDADDSTVYSTVLQAIRDARPDIDPATIDALQERVAEVKGLQAVATELAPEQLQGDLEDLRAKTNWRAVVDGYVADNDGIQAKVGGVIAVRNTDYTDLDYPTTTAASEYVHETKDLFARYGYVLASPDTTTVPEDWRPTPGADDALHARYRETSEIRKYLSPDRLDVVDEVLSFSETASAEFLIRHTQESPGIATDPMMRSLAHAAEAKAEDMKQEFDKRIDATRCEDTDRIAVGGLDLLRDVAGISDPGRWTAGIFVRHPEEFTKGITSIEFVDGIREVTVLEDGRRMVTQGEYATEDRTVKIDISQKQFADVDAHKGKVDEAILEKHREDIRYDIRHALDHELTHHAHNDRMPVSMLREWEQAYGQGRTATTDYGKMNREQQEHQHLIAREDLCDAVAQYLNKPTDLYDASPEQFAVIDKYYHGAWTDKGHEIIQSHIDRKNQQVAE